MESGSIEREIYVDASPDIVFDVISQPGHVKHWWPDDADYDVAPGATGQISFGGDAVGLTVIGVQRPHTFTFRWTQPAGTEGTPGNSLLVTFELTPAGQGTRLKMTETGFRERGWEAAVLEETYQDHVKGWDHFLARINPYASTRP